jgi:hypothetical protein
VASATGLKLSPPNQVYRQTPRGLGRSGRKQATHPVAEITEGAALLQTCELYQHFEDSLGRKTKLSKFLSNVVHNLTVSGS